IELDPGVSLDKTNFVTQEIERIISSMPEVKKVFVNVGASNEGLFGQASNYSSEISVTLLNKEDRKRTTDEVGQSIKEEIQKLSGVKVRINPIGIFGTADDSPIQLIVRGPDRKNIQTAADTIVNILKSIPGTADVRLSSQEGKPETKIDIDREKLAFFGLSIAEVGTTLRIALTGDDESKFRDGNDEYDIRIMLDEFDRGKTSDLNHLTFVNRKGEQIELQQFADIYQTTGPTKLQRKDRMSAITVFSQAVGRPSGSIGEDIKAGLNKTTLPPGIEINYEGDLRMQDDSFGSLGLALLAGILFVYMIMVALYDSYIYPFVVLFSIPVAMVGALLALALFMKSLNIFSILGIIMLVGLVGKNAILLVDRTNQMKSTGLNTYDALIEAGNIRLRPIVMTTLTMVFGMLPIALSTGAGSEWKGGLAWALVGGLTSSMFLTLILVPVVYTLMDSVKIKIPALAGKVFGRKEKIASKISHLAEQR
ncbi:MAG TPA: efflux RND transporter permease subunit, partial [Ignavibacteriaceae bacterium]|nr:efflux RND transporter permease subunit [Ignavibacteriaceae bacterium]